MSSRYFHSIALHGKNTREHFDPVETDGVVQELTITQVAIGPKAKGPNTVQVMVEGEDGISQESILCTLRSGITDQVGVKVYLNQDAYFSLAQGSGPVYLSGYIDIKTYDAEELRQTMMGQLEEHRAEEEAFGKRKMVTNIVEDVVGDTLVTKKARKMVENAALDLVSTHKRGYINSSLEKKDLVKNWEQCCGNWDYILKYQPGSDESDLPRYKKMIKDLIAAGHTREFSKKEKAKRKSHLDKAPEDIDLAEEVNDDGSEDDEDHSEHSSDDDFINDDVDDDVDDELDDDDDDDDSDDSDFDDIIDSEDDDDIDDMDSDDIEEETNLRQLEMKHNRNRSTASSKSISSIATSASKKKKKK